MAKNKTERLLDELKMLATQTTGSHFSIVWHKGNACWRIWFAPKAHFDGATINECIQKAIDYILKERRRIVATRYTLFPPNVNPVR